MKNIIRLSILGISLTGIITAACVMHPSVSTYSEPLTSDEISWIEFCKARGYDIHDNRDEIISEFFDTWVGSVEEEHAFNNLPAQEV